MNVVIVILDSLRRDHVGAYGNDWIETPNLDALAGESLRFTRPYPESIPTVCARRAIYTGRRSWPFRNWEAPRGEPFSPAGWQKIPEDEVSLTGILSAGGYETALVTDTFHLFKPAYNFQQDFDVFEFIRGQAIDSYRLAPSVPESAVDRRTLVGTTPGTRESVHQYLANVAGREGEEEYFAPRVFARAMDYLQTAGRNETPFFLVVDSFDPHEPWDPPEPYASLYGEPIGGREPIMPELGTSDYLINRELRRMRNLYAGEVTMVDHWLGRFIEKLGDLGLAEDTLLLVLSDHGVALGEHGYTGKVPNALWPEITDIVFMIRHPDGRGTGGTSDFYASLHDVAPTVLAALSIEPPRQMTGQNLNPLLENGSPARERPYFTLGYHNYSWARDEDYAMFCLNDGTDAKLYDLRDDPKMTENIASRNPGVVKRMYESYILEDAGGAPPIY